jgi:tRNA/rRNA methyltransferase
LVPRHVTVTLVEPQYPINVGYVARVMKNFGLTRLNLVNPKADMSVALVYASHGAQVIEDARFTTMEVLRKETDLMVATTAVKAKKKGNVLRQAVSPETMVKRVAASRSASLVFGRDTTGLTNEELKVCDMVVAIETGSRYKTLNISHAAAILLYLLFKGGVARGKTTSRKAREVFATSLKDLAIASRMPAHKTSRMFELAMRIASTTDVSDRQLLLMSGVFGKALATLEDQDGDSKT